MTTRAGKSRTAAARPRKPRPSARRGAGPPTAGRDRRAAETLLAMLAGRDGPLDILDGVAALLDCPTRPRAALAGAAVALGRAIDAVGGLRSIPRTGPAVVLVTVPSAEWVGPVAQVAGLCLGGPGDDRGAERGAPMVLEGDGASATHAPDKRNDEVREELALGGIVIGVSHDPARLLPRDLVRGDDLRIDVAGLDRDGIGRVVEAVVGDAPTLSFPAALASACEPADLTLAVHAARGADRSVAKLTGILEAAVGADATGPRLEDMHGYGAARDWGLALVAELRAWRAGGPGAPRWRDLESAILLSGPPGVGKTVFAAALARSAGLNVLAGSLGQWQSARDGHLGHTLGAMRQFFERARSAPCVALIDEVDSFGDRGRLYRGTFGDYSVQVVNAFLEHLDGAAGREGVVLVGATNAPGRIDPAILRSGRLERHVRIDPPDAPALARILRQYLGKAVPGTGLRALANRLVGATGADAEALVRRACGTARRQGRGPTLDDLERAVVEMYPPLPDRSRLRVSVHEAGHLVAAAALGHQGPLSAALHAGGGTSWIPMDESYGLATEERLDERLTVTLAGRAAEEVVLGDVTAGASDDLASATRLAVAMETRMGFSSVAPLVTFQADDLAAMPWAAMAVHRRLSAAYERALDVVRVRRDALLRMADALRRKGRLGDGEIRRLL